MTTELFRVINEEAHIDVTSLLNSEQVFLSVTPDDLVAAKGNYNGILRIKINRLTYGKASVTGLADDGGSGILGQSFESSILLGPQENEKIKRIASSVPSGMLEPPRPVSIRVPVLLPDDFGSQQQFETAVTDDTKFKTFHLNNRYFLTDATKSVLQSGNDLLQQVSRTMFGLSEEERFEIRGVKLENIVLKNEAFGLLAVPVIRSAVSSVSLTGLNPKEWVDPKVIRIQQDAGNLAAANFILKYLGK